MRSLEKGFHDKKGYLERMAMPLQEKLRIAEYIKADAKNILDVGCADGVVTRALAHMFPQAHVKGIDLAADFVGKANSEKGDRENLTYSKEYLREALYSGEKYDHVSFVSVLHEFYSYGAGMTSVMKALADAYELLEPGGRIIVRDMILQERMKGETFAAAQVLKKIRARPEMESVIRDFEKAHGPVDSLYQVNHLLLKYMYTENWERECPENYVPVTREQYDSVAGLMGATLVHEETYCIPYLREKWRADFGLTDAELMELFSTTILVFEKQNPDGLLVNEE